MDNTKVSIKTVFPVYISMTTIPSRIGRTIKIIKNMLIHIEGIQGLILNVCEHYKEVNKSPITKHFDELRNIRDKRFILNITHDIGPITKIVPSLDLVPRESVLIICDDDSYHHDAFKLIAEKQDKIHDKTFTFWKYKYSNLEIPQGVDLVSFWTPNLSDFKRFYNRTKESKHCFFVDDLVIGFYLHNRGIPIEQIPRPWKFPFIPSKEDESLFSKKGEYSRDNSMKKCLMYMM